MTGRLLSHGRSSCSMGDPMTALAAGVLPAQQQRILGHPTPRQECLLAARIASRRPVAALDPGRVPGLELASSRAGGTHARPCHLRAIPDACSRFLTVNHGHSGHVGLRRFSIGKGRHEW
jgi:hypothetical protein